MVGKRVNCEHIYKEMAEDLCMYCGEPTHKTDWQKINALHRQWKIDNPNPQIVWWSI